jgi:streptogramin lyase
MDRIDRRIETRRTPASSTAAPWATSLGLVCLLAAGCGLKPAPSGQTVAGQVNGEATSGVTVTLTGGAKSYSASTSGAGAFAIGSVDNGTYVATASRDGYTFAPSEGIEVKVAGADVGGLAFRSTATHHAIRGTITGAVTADVALQLTGASAANVTSAADGTYAFPAVIDGSYEVRPVLAGHGFTPGARVVILAGADMAGQDFVSSVRTPGSLHAISGTVSGAVTAGVTVTARPVAGAAVSTVTNGSGAFTFVGREDGAYSITPTLTGYAFSPRSLTVTLQGADSLPQLFTAASSTGAVSLDDLATGTHVATGLAIGNDLNAWITDGPAGVISRVLLQDSASGRRGDLLDIQLSPADGQPSGIALRYFGLRCFTETKANRVGCLSWGGDLLFTVAIPTPASGATEIINGPGATQLQPDMWFAEHNVGKVGRLVITEANGVTSGTVSAEYQLPAGCLPTALGWSDGAVWWAAEVCGRIGWIDPVLGTVHVIPVAVGRPVSMTPNLGQPGVWFVDAASDRLGRLSQAGGLSWFSPMVAGSHLAGVVLGPDKALYVTEEAGNAIARFPLSSFDPGADPNRGRLTEEFALPNAGARPQRIVAGTDGNVWFTEGGQARLGVIYMPTHCINGKVTLSDLVTPVKAVTVTLAGPVGAAASAISDDIGNFDFCNLPPGAYVLTPTMAQRVFTPVTLPVTMGTSSLIGRDFVAR